MSTLYETVPLPLPEAPEVTWSQLESLVEVHGHPGSVVTPKLPLPPPCPTLALDGLIEYEQMKASWLTVNVLPPIVSVPERAEPELAATEYPTVPLPLPLAPLVTVSQAALLVAVQEQPGGATTPTLPVPPAKPKF
jgi:hypothetical protein